MRGLSMTLVAIIYLLVLFIGAGLLVLFPLWMVIEALTGWSYFKLYKTLCLAVQSYD